MHRAPLERAGSSSMMGQMDYTTNQSWRGSTPQKGQKVGKVGIRERAPDDKRLGAESGILECQSSGRVQAPEGGPGYDPWERVAELK